MISAKVLFFRSILATCFSFGSYFTNLRPVGGIEQNVRYFNVEVFEVVDPCAPDNKVFGGGYFRLGFWHG